MGLNYRQVASPTRERPSGDNGTHGIAMLCARVENVAAGGRNAAEAQSKQQAAAAELGNSPHQQEAIDHLNYVHKQDNQSKCDGGTPRTPHPRSPGSPPLAPLPPQPAAHRSGSPPSTGLMRQLNESGSWFSEVSYQTDEASEPSEPEQASR